MFLLLITHCASNCLQHSHNLEHRLKPISVQNSGHWPRGPWHFAREIVAPIDGILHRVCTSSGFLVWEPSLFPRQAKRFTWLGSHSQQQLEKLNKKRIRPPAGSEGGRPRGDRLICFLRPHPTFVPLSSQCHLDRACCHAMGKSCNSRGRVRAPRGSRGGRKRERKWTKCIYQLSLSLSIDDLVVGHQCSLIELHAMLKREKKDKSHGVLIMYLFNQQLLLLRLDGCAGSVCSVPD